MDNKKKILIFSTTYHPFVGGAEVAVKEITDRLGDEYDFDMVTLKFDRNLPDYEKIGNINIYRLGFTQINPSPNDLVKFPLKINKILFPFLAWWRAGDLHAEKQYDAIWSIMASYAGFGALFFKLGHSEVPYLLTLQEGDPVDYIKRKTRFVKPLFNRIFTKADSIQAISNYLAEWARDMNFKGSLEVVPNAVNVAHFSQIYSESDLNELNNGLGKKENDKYVITTSRLVKKNGVEDVIKSLKYLPENIKFIILGDGPDWQKLEDIANREGVKERVKFMGSIDHKEIPKYLKISDVFIRPSLSEGFGNSFIEAMASGVPVIATKVGGIVDFLKDEETGIFCEVQNPKSIADKIELILENQILREKLIQNAKNMVIQKYDWSIISKDIKNKVFNKLI